MNFKLAACLSNAFSLVKRVKLRSAHHSVLISVAEVGVNGEVLVIHNVTRYCGDIYECVAFNGVPPAVSHLIRVGVKCE